MTGEAPNIFVEIKKRSDCSATTKIQKNIKESPMRNLERLSVCCFLVITIYSKSQEKDTFNKDALDTEYLVHAYYDQIFYLSEEDDKKGVYFKRVRKKLMKHCLLNIYIFKQEIK